MLRLPCVIEDARCTRTSEVVDVRDGVEAGVDAAGASVACVDSKLENAVRSRFQTSDTPLSTEPAWGVDVPVSREHSFLVARPGCGQIAGVRRTRMASGRCQAHGIISFR